MNAKPMKGWIFSIALLLSLGLNGWAFHLLSAQHHQQTLTLAGALAALHSANDQQGLAEPGAIHWVELEPVEVEVDVTDTETDSDVYESKEPEPTNDPFNDLIIPSAIDQVMSTKESEVTIDAPSKAPESNNTDPKTPESKKTELKPHTKSHTKPLAEKKPVTRSQTTKTKANQQKKGAKHAGAVQVGFQTPAQRHGIEGRILRGIESCYPEISRRRGEEGIVRINLYINHQGQMERTEITQSSGYARLDRCAEQAVNKALRGEKLNRAAGVLALPPIHFRLR